MMIVNIHGPSSCEMYSFYLFLLLNEYIYIDYLQEKEDSLSLHENDSKIKFTHQSLKQEQLYDEIEANRANKFDSLNTLKRSIQLNRQNVFSKPMYLYGKDRNLFSCQIYVLLEDDSGVGNEGAKEVYFIFIEHLVQVTTREEKNFHQSFQQTLVIKIIMQWGKCYYHIIQKYCPLCSL